MLSIPVFRRLALTGAVCDFLQNPNLNWGGPNRIDRKRGDPLLEWRRFRKPKNMRCPYCVEGNDFKLMAVQTGGDWFLCATCGHLSLPSHPSFRCMCGKCVTVAKVPQARTTD